VIAGTLYILTIATVTIMPAQLMTGMFGMNFVGDPETQDENGAGETGAC
jgi:Mg2+ and Co2+ transporter CorA